MKKEIIHNKCNKKIEDCKCKNSRVKILDKLEKDLCSVCGHCRYYHSKTNNINYTEGHCKKCSCDYFMMSSKPIVVFQNSKFLAMSNEIFEIRPILAKYMNQWSNNMLNELATIIVNNKNGIKKDCIKIIKADLKWHINNYKKNVISKDKKDGFISGLKQAILLVNKL